MWARECQKFEPIVISPPVPKDGPHLPGFREVGERKPQRHDFAQSELRCDQYADPGFGQISAVRVELLTFLAR